MQNILFKNKKGSQLHSISSCFVFNAREGKVLGRSLLRRKWSRIATLTQKGFSPNC